MLAAFVTRLGGRVPGLPGGVTRTFPDPATVTSDSLAPVGLPEAEAAAVVALAGTLAPAGPVRMEPGQWRPWVALAATHLTAREPLCPVTR
jgi:hypothetical protein